MGLSRWPISTEVWETLKYSQDQTRNSLPFGTFTDLLQERWPSVTACRHPIVNIKLSTGLWPEYNSTAYSFCSFPSSLLYLPLCVFRWDLCQPNWLKLLDLSNLRLSLLSLGYRYMEHSTFSTTHFFIKVHAFDLWLSESEQVDRWGPGQPARAPQWDPDFLLSICLFWVYACVHLWGSGMVAGVSSILLPWLTQR